MQQPSVGRMVHYVSYGTPGGKYASVCRAAVITEIPSKANELGSDWPVNLCVLNPGGMFFDKQVLQSEEDHRGGTWHWPERV